MTAHLQYLPVDVGVLVLDVEGIEGIPYADSGRIDGDVVVDVRHGHITNLALFLLRPCRHGGEGEDEGDDFLIHNDMLCLFQFQRFIRMRIGFQLACAAVDGSTGFQMVAVGGYL